MKWDAIGSNRVLPHRSPRYPHLSPIAEIPLPSDLHRQHSEVVSVHATVVRQRTADERVSQGNNTKWVCYTSVGRVKVIRCTRAVESMTAPFSSNRHMISTWAFRAAKWRGVRSNYKPPKPICEKKVDHTVSILVDRVICAQYGLIRLCTAMVL